MKCPYCFREIPFSTVCPACGRALHFGGNTQFLAEVQQGRLGVKDIFAQTFKRHKKGDAFRSLTRRPALTAEMLETWQRPWMFLRLFGILLVATVLLSFAAQSMLQLTPAETQKMLEYGRINITDKQIMQMNLPIAVIAYIVGSTVVPWTMLMFMWEMDMYGNLSIFDLLGLLLVGGLLSIAITMPYYLLMQRIFSLGNGYSSSWAAVAEEPAKITIAILFILLSKRKLNALDGLVIGAAIAVGFAFIETTQYGYKYMFYYQSVAGGLSTVQGRNFGNLFSSHLSYTAPVLGALGLAANGERVKLRHFLNWRVLLCLVIGMGCHAINNSTDTIPGTYAFSFFFYPVITIGEFELKIYDIILAAIEWPTLLLVMRGGIRQALEASERGKTMAYMEHYGKIDTPKVSDTPQVPDIPQTPLLCGQAGSFSGQKLRVPMNKPISMGREASCQLVLASKQVSRKHCEVHATADGLIIRDLNSANGTKVNGARIPPQQDVPLKRGDRVEVGSKDECFVIQ